MGLLPAAQKPKKEALNTTWKVALKFVYHRQPKLTRIPSTGFRWTGAGEVKAATFKLQRWSPTTATPSSSWLASLLAHSLLVPYREQAEPSLGSSRRDWPLVEGVQLAAGPANDAGLSAPKDPLPFSPCGRPRILTGQTLRHLALVVRGWPMQTESFPHYIFCPAPPAAREQKAAENHKSRPSRNESSSPSPTRTHCVAVHAPASWWCVCGWPLSSLSGNPGSLVLPLT